MYVYNILHFFGLVVVYYMYHCLLLYYIIAVTTMLYLGQIKLHAHTPHLTLLHIDHEVI